MKQRPSLLRQRVVLFLAAILWREPKLARAAWNLRAAPSAERSAV